MLEAFVTNLGRYNEGYLDGEYLKLPATTEDVQALLKRIHVDGVRYEEIFITDYETDISGLHDCLGEYESIDELNYLASMLDDMDEGEQAKFEAALSYGDYTGSLKDLITLRYKRIELLSGTSHSYTSYRRFNIFIKLSKFSISRT